jgi:hypothetical protein
MKQVEFYTDHASAAAAGATYYLGTPCEKCRWKTRWTSTRACMRCNNVAPDLVQHTRRFNLAAEPVYRRAIAGPYSLTLPKDVANVGETVLHEPVIPPGGFTPGHAAHPRNTSGASR